MFGCSASLRPYGFALDGLILSEELGVSGVMKELSFSLAELRLEPVVKVGEEKLHRYPVDNPKSQGTFKGRASDAALVMRQGANVADSQNGCDLFLRELHTLSEVRKFVREVSLHTFSSNFNFGFW